MADIIDGSVECAVCKEKSIKMSDIEVWSTYLYGNKTIVCPECHSENIVQFVTATKRDGRTGA